MKDKLDGIKAIFFDAGGTLIHLDSSFICSSVGVEVGGDSSPENFRRAQYMAMARVAELVAAGAGSTESLKREFYSTLLPKIGVSQENLTSAVECALNLAQAEMLWRKADDTTAPTLRQLRERAIILGVVSNSDGRIEHAFRQAGLAEYFEFFIDSFIVGVEKPDPAIFLMATERARVSPREAVYVGDLYGVDVIGARAAGLTPVLYDPYQLNRNADCLTISAIGDLLALVDD
ncbi:MAG TPA: HAD-IA family hydrolase [Blastocatellia bacterium]|nr:HAD-IA family hydrolase [Blastocatellia bacterium]